MKVKEALLTFFSLLLIPLTSALSYTGFGGYSSFSVSNLLSGIDAQTIFILCLWAILFVLLFWILNRFNFGQNIAGIISFAISLLAVYGINKLFDFEEFLYSLGLGDSLFYILITIFIVLFGWMVWKFRKRLCLLSFLVGLLLIGISLTDFFAEPGIIFVIGLILALIVPILCWKFKKKPGIGETQSSNPNDIQDVKYEDLPSKNSSNDKLNLARNIGIKNLTKEYNDLASKLRNGFSKAQDLHKEATRLGWTKAGVKPRKGENPGETQKRAALASDAYKSWYRQYSQNIQDEKRLKEIGIRIDHLKKQLR